MTPDHSEAKNKNIFKKIITLIQKPFQTKTDGIYGNQVYENLDIPSQDMIRGVIELSGLNARDIMIPRVDTIAVDSRIALKPLVALINNAGHSRFPVYQDTIDNITGILYVKDLIKLLTEKSKKFNIKKLLRDPFFVPESMPLKELLYEFKKKKLHLAIVVDEYGGVGGIVTMEDILEEIVGEIRDEYDDDEIPELNKISKYTYELDPRMTIGDFNESLGMTLPTEDFDTIGGFILNAFGRIPKKNEIIKYSDIIFKIKDIKGTVINRIIATVPKQK